MIRHPPRSPLFPSPPLSRSPGGGRDRGAAVRDRRDDPAWVHASDERVVADPGERLSRRSEEHTSELQSRSDLVCRLLLEKKKHLTHARPNTPSEIGQPNIAG